MGAPTDQSFDNNMMDLFAIELETQTALLNKGLIDYEQKEEDPRFFESLMRAAHSLKGAARVVRIEPVVKIAHALEDCFVAVQQKKITLDSIQIDYILKVIDFLTALRCLPTNSYETYLNQKKPEVEQLIKGMEEIKNKHHPALALETQEKVPIKIQTSSLPSTEQQLKVPLINPKKIEPPPREKNPHEHDRILRVTADSLNRLMGLAGESLVESRWLHPFSDSLNKVKTQQNELLRTIDQLNETLREVALGETTRHFLEEVQKKANDCFHDLSERMSELELFIGRYSSLSERFYQEVIDSRMRPFADGIEGFPRMVRDLARQLNKKVTLEITGKSTPVDRDILEKLESPLAHLLRNAVDHGIETPEERVAKGKPPEGKIRLVASHSAGMLAITVSDDGRGVDLEALRQRIVIKRFVTEEVASKLSESELLDFLFLPGFSTATELTEISGRGVGLNIVQNMIQQVSGVVRIKSEPNQGMSFFLQLPLTLSVIRSLLVQISGEPYAFPLSGIESSLLIPRGDIEVIENRQFFNFEGVNVGLVPAWQVLDLAESKQLSNFVSVIILSDRTSLYGVVVDHFIGQKEIVVQELDSRLGKVSDINSGAFMEDGSPLLIIDVEDMVRSIDILLSGGRLQQLNYVEDTESQKIKKRILVVDDSITVREVESRLLRNNGYEVETAVNGADGWNAIRIGNYDLIVTDVDMPRMNGIELIKAIRGDTRLKNLPIMIVSYKERDEDRVAGLEAGANYYLTKSSFHDESLINGIKDLIGN